ncbi:unnamed protein product [Mytilus coruscus]|uniref:Uncharacterized protein n=1 Tax=Mytilus coruscus TaxID=42192 RepID=A0A6J7ZSV7_MYTCO|nr:unnamed protein product [Mytilus coruscus]
MCLIINRVTLRPGRPPSGRRDRPLSDRSDGSGEHSVWGERPFSVRGERPSGVRSCRAESRPHSGRSDRSAREREEKVEILRQQHAAKKIQRGWRTKKGDEDKERDVKVQKFKENRAAKKIQNEWTGYKHRKYEADYDEAADTITAALKGHQSRQQRIHKFQYYDESETEDESLTDATDLIYSSLKGHNNRKDKMKRMRSVADEEEDFSSSRRASRTSHSRQHTPPNRMRPGSAHSRASNSSQRSANRHTGKTNYRMASDYDDDDDIEM